MATSFLLMCFVVYPGIWGSLVSQHLLLPFNDNLMCCGDTPGVSCVLCYTGACHVLGIGHLLVYKCSVGVDQIQRVYSIDWNLDSVVTEVFPFLLFRDPPRALWFNVLWHVFLRSKVEIFIVSNF